MELLKIEPHLEAMSLIPSESYSFPDHFTRTVTPSRKPKEKPVPKIVVGLPRHKNTVVPMPRPDVPVRQSTNGNGESPPNRIAPAVFKRPLRTEIPLPPAPQPATRKIALPANLKLKVRWNNRTPVSDLLSEPRNGNGNLSAATPNLPAHNVIPIRPVRPPQPPHTTQPEIAVMPTPMAAAPLKKAVPPVKPPRPANLQPAPINPRPAATSQRQSDFFEMFTESGETVLVRRRRKMKMRRFIACEAVALGLLLPFVILGLSREFTSPAVVWSMNILTIAAAVATATIPIVFFAFTPTLPEREG